MKPAAHNGDTRDRAHQKRGAQRHVPRALFFLPNQRSFIALEMTSIRSMPDKISGTSIDDAAFSRLTSDAFLPIPMPRACCD